MVHLKMASLLASVLFAHGFSSEPTRESRAADFGPDGVESILTADDTDWLQGLTNPAGSSGALGREDPAAPKGDITGHVYSTGTHSHRSEGKWNIFDTTVGLSDEAKDQCAAAYDGCLSAFTESEVRSLEETRRCMGKSKGKCKKARCTWKSKAAVCVARL
jgi:hypothetical protein